MFSRWGAFVYRFRRPIVVLTVLLAVGAATLATRASGQLSSGGWLDERSVSADVANRIQQEFGGGRSSLVALFHSTTSRDATSAAFQADVAATLAGLASDPRVSGVTGYAQTGDRRFISTNGDAAYVVIGLDLTDDQSVAAVDSLKAKLDPPAGISVGLTGFGPITKDSAAQSEVDLQRAEAVSLPIAAIVLLIVFGALVAAAMPLLVAGLAIPSTLALIYLVAQHLEMSVYVLNIATMLGLALAIDYSLFIVSRFREELARGRTVAEAVERAVGTAGKAVAFSGLAVGIGLSGLLWFRATALSSIGIAGALVVLCSVFYALTFLPAILGMVGPRINALSVGGLLVRIGLRGDGPAVRHSRWERVAQAVMRRPIAVVMPVLLLLFVVGSPFFGLQQGVPDATIYPAGMPSRDAYVALQTEFQRGETTPIELLVDVAGPPTDAAAVTAVMAYQAKLAAVDGISRIEGPFTITDPKTGAAMTADQVVAFYAAPAAQLPPALAAARSALLGRYVRGSTVRLDAVSPIDPALPAGTAVIPRVRALPVAPAISRVEVGGTAASGYDFLQSQNDRMPWAIGTTLLASALILFLLFGSVVIPVKAVIMTLLSISASFGALVWIFQDGNLSNILDFTPVGYTVAGTPIIMFSIIFGLSMDYEVLLLSRIQEAYRRTGDNRLSVAEGLSRTAGVITGAALIMVSVFAAFALAQIITIKSIGVGMTVAVLLDATVIRVLLVPATMRLLGAWNWWAPGILGRLVHRLGFSHIDDDGPAAEDGVTAGAAATPAG